MDASSPAYRPGRGKSRNARAAMLATLVVLVLAAAYYYIKVYKPKRAAGKDGYHAPWGMTTQANRDNRLINQSGTCLSPQQAAQHGCAIECAEFTDGMTYSDCMYKCANGTKRVDTRNECKNC
jgi:hypothetical protein